MRVVRREEVPPMLEVSIATTSAASTPPAWSPREMNAYNGQSTSNINIAEIGATDVAPPPYSPPAPPAGHILGRCRRSEWCKDVMGGRWFGDGDGPAPEVQGAGAGARWAA